MEVLEPYISQLALDVPPLAEQRRYFDRLSSRQTAWRVGRKEKKLAKKQQISDEKSIYSYGSDDDPYLEGKPPSRAEMKAAKEAEKKGAKKEKLVPRMEFIVVQKLEGM